MLISFCVVAGVAGRQDRAGVNRRPVGRRLDRRMVLRDVAAVGPDEVILDVLPLGGRDRGQIVDQVVAARHLDQPGGVAQALVEDLARIVVEARPGADAVIGISIGVGQQQFLAELRVLLLARQKTYTVPRLAMSRRESDCESAPYVCPFGDILLSMRCIHVAVRTLLRLGNAQRLRHPDIHRCS